MGTTAEFRGYFTHLYYTNGFAILLTEESHSTGLLRFIKGHHLSINGKSCTDSIIYDRFDLSNLFLGHSREMSEVETDSVSVVVRTSLLYMLTQNLLQSSL